MQETLRISIDYAESSNEILITSIEETVWVMHAGQFGKLPGNLRNEADLITLVDASNLYVVNSIHDWQLET